MINSKKIVIICGAGISRMEPTCLPLGKALTEFYIDYSCGKGTADKMFQLTSDISCFIEKDISLPRLETIVGAIDSIDQTRQGDEESMRMLNGFNSFSNAPINKNHVLIAQMLLAGSTVITFNFDRCIEKATELICGKPVRTEKAFGVYRSYNAKGSQLFHLHGACENIESLGVTVSSITKGIPISFEHEFDSILETAEEVLFLGYSFSDFFDFVPFIQNKKHRLKGKCITYVNHRGYDTQINERIQLLFDGQELVVLEVDTTEYLEGLTAQPYEAKTSNDVFSWITAFEESLKFHYSEDEMFLNLAQICSSIGILPTVLLNQEWSQVFTRLERIVEKNPCNRNLGLISSLAKDVGDIKSYYLFRKRMTNRTQNLICEAEDIHQYIPTSSLHKLENECRRNIMLHFRHILDLRWYYTQLFDDLDQHIQNYGKIKYSELSAEAKLKIDEILAILDFLYHAPYRKFSGVSQRGSIIATLCLFLTIKNGQEESGLIDEEIRLYSEISAYASIGRAYLHALKMNIYMFFIHHEYSHAITACNMLHKAKRILTLCGNTDCLERLYSDGLFDYFKRFCVELQLDIEMQ